MSKEEKKEQIAKRLEAIVLGVHRRNSGKLEALPWQRQLLAPELGLDSLDLAEIIAAVEREWSISPFDEPHPPRTWQELLDLIVRSEAAKKDR